MSLLHPSVGETATQRRLGEDNATLAAQQFAADKKMKADIAKRNEAQREVVYGERESMCNCCSEATFNLPENKWQLC